MWSNLHVISLSFSLFIILNTANLCQVAKDFDNRKKINWCMTLKCLWCLISTRKMIDDRPGAIDSKFHTSVKQIDSMLLCVCAVIGSLGNYNVVHFFDVYCTTMTWNLLTGRFMGNVDIRRWILNLNKILKNSSPGKVACIWHIEQVQIDAIKSEVTQIHVFTDVFTAVVVIPA